MYYQRPLFIRIIESFCRYWRIFVATTLTIVVLLAAFILTRPKNYVTVYTVILNTQTLINPGTGQAEIIDWQAVNQSVGHFQTLVMTKDFIADALSDVDDPNKPGEHLESKINLSDDSEVLTLQKGISISSNGPDSFTVGLIWRDADDSPIILEALINKFMVENAQQKSATFTQQVAFDKQQVDSFAQQTQDCSAKLTDFNTKHITHGPDQTSSIIQELANENQRLADAKIQYAQDESRAALMAQTVNSIPKEIVSQQSVGTSPLEMEIRNLQIQLDEDIAKGYKANHPDVIAKTRQLNALRAREAQLNGKGEANNVNAEEKQPNPAYDAAKYQLDTLRIDLSGESTKLSQLAAQIQTQAAGVSKLPEEEREYSNLLNQYQFASVQLQKAQDALQDATDQEEISLKEQTSAYTPFRTQEPELSTSKSKTAMLFAGGLVLALMLSAGLVILAEASDRSFRDAYDLQRTLGVPVLALLPESADLHIDDSRTLLGGPSGAKRLGGGQTPQLTGAESESTTGDSKAA